jgi:AraC-like DNA-binding protein
VDAPGEFNDILAYMIWLDEGGCQRGLQLIFPPPRLRGDVEHFWIQQAMPKNVWRIVPDINAHAIFSIKRETNGLRTNVCIVGARSEFFDLDVTNHVLTIGVRFRAGVLPLLVRDSAERFTDRSIAFDEIWGCTGSSLVERMMDGSPGHALSSLTQFLLERFPSHRTAPLSPLAQGAASVTSLTRELGVPRRTLYNRVLTTIGLSPKLALRIERMHDALFELNSGAPLAAAAVGAGYSDQSHFTRETVSLLGEAPAAWRRRGCSIVQDNNELRQQ